MSPVPYHNPNNSGAGWLRQALCDANATAAADTIALDTAGHFSVPQAITLTSGELGITRPVTVEGSSMAGRRVTISGGAAGRVSVGGDVVFDPGTFDDAVPIALGGEIVVVGAVEVHVLLVNCHPAAVLDGTGAGRG